MVVSPKIENSRILRSMSCCIAFRVRCSPPATGDLSDVSLLTQNNASNLTLSRSGRLIGVSPAGERPIYSGKMPFSPGSFFPFPGLMVFVQNRRCSERNIGRATRRSIQHLMTIGNIPKIMISGRKFPPCRSFSNHPRYKAVRLAMHVERNEHLRWAGIPRDDQWGFEQVRRPALVRW